MCNPRGYSGYESRAQEFDPTFGFDIWTILRSKVWLFFRRYLIAHWYHGPAKSCMYFNRYKWFTCRIASSVTCSPNIS
jgi:hypothetical protein